MSSNSRSLTKNYLLIGLATSAVMLAVSGYGWIQIPAGTEIPIHWNFAGEVDRTTGKAEGLLLLPAISMVAFILLSLIPKLEPRRGNVERSAKAYLATGVVFGGIMLTVHSLVVLASLGYSVNTTAVLTAAIGVMLIVMGNFMGKIRSNFVFGMRTPWTLSSELSWNKTHRLTGKLFMLWGLVVLVLSFAVSPTQSLIYTACGLFCIIVFACVYSYRVWCSDPAAQHA